MNKKKKVGIVTIYDLLPNYGNRLQNYAVRSIISNLGFDVFTYSFEPNPLVEEIKNIFHRMLGHKVEEESAGCNNVPFQMAILNKIKRFSQIMVFHRFNQKYIKTKRISHIPNKKEADYFVLGSDQVWHEQWYNTIEMKKNMYLLTFASPEQKVCFAPSFGVTDISKESKSFFREHLSTFPRISVREQSGATLIKELIGVDAEVLIDPTLMLEKEEWRKLSCKPKKIDVLDTYILTYFLGGRTQRIDTELEKYASLLNAKVYHIMDYSQPELFPMGPCEFLYLIDHAKLVLTDSFHACVFSFLFGKPFLLYKREGASDMMSRMETLFEKFDLKRKYVDSGLENNLLECDYEKGYKNLEKEREKVMCFLKESFRME